MKTKQPTTKSQLQTKYTNEGMYTFHFLQKTNRRNIQARGHPTI